MRTLRIAAGAEAASLAILLANLLTTHTEAVASLVGPLHGTAYLVTIAAVWQLPDTAGSGARWRAAVPGVGGLLAVRRLRTGVRTGTATTTATTTTTGTDTVIGTGASAGTGTGSAQTEGRPEEPATGQAAAPPAEPPAEQETS